MYRGLRVEISYCRAWLTYPKIILPKLPFQIGLRYLFCRIWQMRFFWACFVWETSRISRMHGENLNLHLRRIDERRTCKLFFAKLHLPNVGSVTIFCRSAKKTIFCRSAKNYSSYLSITRGSKVFEFLLEKRTVPYESAELATKSSLFFSFPPSCKWETPNFGRWGRNSRAGLLCWTPYEILANSPTCRRCLLKHLHSSG